MLSPSTPDGTVADSVNKGNVHDCVNTTLRKVILLEHEFRAQCTDDAAKFVVRGLIRCILREIVDTHEQHRTVFHLLRLRLTGMPRGVAALLSACLDTEEECAPQLML